MVRNSIALELGQALAPDLLEACRALGNLAEPGTLYIVGGAIRDILLGRQPDEVDLVLQGNAEELGQRAVQARLARRTVGSQFMTIKLTIGSRDIDIATARTETYPSSGALPDVTPADIATDLGRRDFAANAIAASIGSMDFGRVMDPHGGINDVQAGVLRALHPASFRDDPTRMIRAARYAARLRFKLHVDTETRLKDDAMNIRMVGPDRLRNEFNRLWSEEKPVPALHMLQTWGVLDHIPTASNWLNHLYSISVSDREAAARPDDANIADVYWALVATTLSQDHRSLIQSFNLTGSARRAVEDIRFWKMDGLVSFHDAHASGRASRISGVLSLLESPALVAIYLTGEATEAHAIASYLGAWRHVTTELNGNDLLKLGVPQGPLVGKYLDHLRNDRLDGLVLVRDGELALIRQWLARDSASSAES